MFSLTCNFGDFHNLYPSLKKDPSKFFNYLRMSRECFVELLELVKCKIQRQETNFKHTISAEERLLITLRYLSAGCSMTELHHYYQHTISTITGIVKDTCQQIYKTLREICLPELKKEDWLRIAQGFATNANFPNCLGAIDEDRPRRPSDGPGADIDTGITILLNNEQIEQRFNDYDPTKRIQNEFSNEKNLYNVSTLPLKSENDKVFTSRNIPDISFLQSLNNKPTIPVIPSESRNLSEPSLNIPNLSLILRHVNKNSVQNVSTRSQSDVESTQDSVESVHKQAEAENNSYFQKSLPNIADLHSHIDKIILEDTNLINFEYGELENITCKFSETIVEGPFGPSGKIGSGGFGEVFVGYHPKYGIPLAVKKIHSHLLWPTHKPQMAIDMFNTEVKNLTQFRHKNIVPILGFSMNGPVPCIICEYIEGGSLEQQLAAKVLNERQRINIMLGTAEGLKYLHKSEQPTQSISVESDTQNVRKNNFVHRDVKSANILLTKECVPKICDFGLVKQYESTFVTTSPMGTSAYMAPEGFNGTITQKIDIYSYGIVLLELLTGLKPIVVNNNSDTINIKDYVKEHIKEKGEIDSVLDPVVSKWTKAEEIYKLSESCLQLERTSRPSIENICEVLNNINNS